MLRSIRFLTISLSLLLIFSAAALADTCDKSSIFTCGKSHDGAFIGGSGTAIGGQGAGLLLNSNMFTVSTHNGDAGADVIIVAAIHGTLTGTLDGKSFTSLSVFPEGGATGAIMTNLAATGFCTAGPSCSLSYGYVNLGVALPANGSITVNASGITPGTAIYALILNSKGQVIITTSNSSSGVDGGTPSTVPEPGSLSLMITGLCGIAGGAWRKLRG